MDIEKVYKEKYDVKLGLESLKIIEEFFKEHLEEVLLEQVKVSDLFTQVANLDELFKEVVAERIEFSQPRFDTLNPFNYYIFDLENEQDWLQHLRNEAKDAVCLMKKCDSGKITIYSYTAIGGLETIIINVND